MAPFWESGFARIYVADERDIVMGSKATATFTSQAGDQELQMKGNFFDTSADITDNKRGGMSNT